MATPLPRGGDDDAKDDDFHLLPLLKGIPAIAWLLIKMLLWFLCFFAFLAATFYAAYRLCKLTWHLPWYYGEARKWYAARKERGAEAAHGGGQTELEPLEGCAYGGGGEGEGGSVDGETRYDGGEEGKGVV